MADEESDFESGDENNGEQDSKLPYVPGTVYFMRETDFLTGETFPYYKIGIVKNDKEVDKRLAQHRTGNPRDIITVRDIVSPAAQKLETRLHNEYASHRVASGEWFNFTDELLARAIARAVELNEQLSAEIDVLNSAKKIKAPGPGKPLASEPYLKAAEQLGPLLAEKEIISKVKKHLSKLIKALAEGNPQWERLLEARNNDEKNAFNVEILKKKHKALYEEFKTKESQSITPKWLVEIPKLEDGQVLAKFNCSDIDSIGDNPIELHQAFLKVWAAAAEIDWEIEIIQARMLHDAKKSTGIVDVLEWKITNSKNFDTAKFIEKHKTIYDDCFKTTEAKITYRVVEWASYAL